MKTKKSGLLIVNRCGYIGDDKDEQEPLYPLSVNKEEDKNSQEDFYPMGMNVVKTKPVNTNHVELPLIPLGMDLDKKEKTSKADTEEQEPLFYGNGGLK